MKDMQKVREALERIIKWEVSSIGEASLLAQSVLDAIAQQKPEPPTTDRDAIPMVERATGRTIPDLTKREHVCEWQQSITPRAQEVPTDRVSLEKCDAFPVDACIAEMEENYQAYMKDGAVVSASALNLCKGIVRYYADQADQQPVESTAFAAGLAAGMPNDHAKLLWRIGDLFGVGSAVRNEKTLMVNIENAARRSHCLSMIEGFLTTTTEEDGEEHEDCPLNWGDSPEEYLKKFKAAWEARDSERELITPKKAVDTCED